MVNSELPHAAHVPPAEGFAYPSSHASQVFPFLSYPASHTQSVIASLPSRDCELSGQVWQVEAAFAADCVENVSTLHLVQVDGPTTSLYSPALHAVHGLAEDSETLVPISQ